jgi:hypothetical protein
MEPSLVGSHPTLRAADNVRHLTGRIVSRLVSQLTENLSRAQRERTLNPNCNRFGWKPSAGVGVLYLAAADGKRGLG